MAIDPRTPVLVGVGTAGSRSSDDDAGALMTAAAVAAATDAGSTALLRQAGAILVPKGTWPYHDAGRLVASAVGNAGARTTLAEIGVLQTTPIDLAASAIAHGDLDVALVVGGEAKWRNVRARLEGMTDPVERDDRGATPDRVLAPDHQIISAQEIGAGLVSATAQYAMIDNARRYADGQSLDDHRAEIAALCESFNGVARTNPSAWIDGAMTADAIATAGPDNRLLAWPYNKWHVSQWNVNQAACLVLCSADAARAHGVPIERWVFPHAIAWSDHMAPMTARKSVHRSPGFALAGRAALRGLTVDDVGHLELYSCFPIAVRTQALELGIACGRQLTVTGGMTFAGGPLNNFVLQALVRMVQVLRDDSGSLGLVTAISGIITKQAATLWGARPPDGGYRSINLSAEAEAATPLVPVAAAGEAPTGPAIVATYTVVADRLAAPRAIVLAEAADGGRSIAGTDDPDTVAAMMAQEWCGRAIALDGSGGFRA